MHDTDWHAGNGMLEDAADRALSGSSLSRFLTETSTCLSRWRRQGEGKRTRNGSARKGEGQQAESRCADQCGQIPPIPQREELRQRWSGVVAADHPIDRGAHRLAAEHAGQSVGVRGRPGLRLHLAALVALVMVIAQLPAAGGSLATPQLRFGKVKWEQIGAKRIRFVIESAWTPLTHPASIADTMYCEPLLTSPYSCRNEDERPKLGSTLALKTPTAQPYSNRWVYGDEHLTGHTNGTALRGMRIVEDKSMLPTGRGYMRTLTEVEYEYTHHGVFHAALTGCCRGWEKLLNHRGYGWNVSTTVVVDSLWEPVVGIPPSKGGPYSPDIPYVPEILITKGLATEFHIQAVDHVRSAAPGLCDPGPGGVTTGCRLKYSFGNHEESGFNISYSSYRARKMVGTPVGGTTDLGFPFGIYEPAQFFPADTVDPLDGRIELDSVTGMLRIPKQVSAGMVLAPDTDYRAMSVVIRVTASRVARPDGRASRDPTGGTETPEITVSLDFTLIFQTKFVPRVSLPYLASQPDYTPGPQDVSSAPYVDFFCEYLTDYRLNSTGVVKMLTPPDGLNYTALGSAQRYLQLTHVSDPRFGSNFLINLSWSAPCSAVDLYPSCLVSCTTNDPATDICSPPACFRMEVRGDCLQGDSTWLAPTPPEYLGYPDREPLSVLMGETLQFRVRAGGVAIGERDGITLDGLIGFHRPSVTPIVGPDRMIAVLTDPGLPNGANEGVNMHEGEHNVSRLFSWTPQKGQEGITYLICFQAQSDRKAEYCVPSKRCVRVKAVVPMQFIQEAIIQILPLAPQMKIPAGIPPPPPPPSPRFIDAAGMVTENTRVQIAPGCLVKVRISVDRSVTGALVEPEPSVGIPPGATLSPVPELQGQDLGGGLYRDTYEIAWRPTRDFRHPTYPACIRVRDTLGSRSEASGTIDSLGGASGVELKREHDRCYQYDLLRCRFCAQAEQSLEHVAAYWYGADWIQLWGVNPEITVPDRLPDNALLRLGPTYLVKRGDTLLRLADRYGMTLPQLQALNPEADEKILKPGDALCIMPTVCPVATH